MNSEQATDLHLSLQAEEDLPSVVVLGEVLWDLFGDVRRLGGAPLNFGAHARRLGHPVTLISAVGTDELGANAAELIESMGLGTELLQKTERYPTGTARVNLGLRNNTEFTIQRPAAYDAVRLGTQDVEFLRRQQASWFYYGTLFASTPQGLGVLKQILGALEDTVGFYDLNLRPGADSPQLVTELLQHADVVKLNEHELEWVHKLTGLPLDIEAFCREGIARYGWHAAGVTLGDRGCAVLVDGQYAEAGVYPVDVIDTVGAGDAFAAAFMHGLSLRWPAAKIASFANRIGALVASRHGAIPDWTLAEAVELR